MTRRRCVRYGPPRMQVATWSVLVAAVVFAPPGVAARVVDNEAPTITHTPTSCPVAPQPCTVEADIVDKSGVFEPTLLVRLPGMSAYERVAMKAAVGTDHYVATIPPALSSSNVVEYLIEAFDVNGNGPAHAGLEAAPLLAQRAVAAAPVDPVVGPVPAPVVVESEGNPWLGVGIGAGVVAAVAIAGGVALAVYFLRPAAVDEVNVVVSGPLPYSAVQP